MTSNQFKKAVEYNQKQLDLGKVGPEEITELTRFWQAGHDLKIDGMLGPMTLSTLESRLVPQTAPRDPGGHVDWDRWFDGPLERQPKNRREVYDIFGNPGSGKVNPSWVRSNIVELHPKHGNQLPGVPGKWYVQVHKLVEPYLREGLRRARAAAPYYEIERIAGFVFRHIRHDPSRPLSMHSWGIAVDIDPHKNRGRSFARGKAPKAWSGEYMKIWPNGLPREFVEAMQSCGFAWGSDWDEDGATHDHTYLDPMHFEFVARDGKSALV